MAKKFRPGPLTVTDIEEYLRDESDFAFELVVLDSLCKDGFNCEHGGTYDDPITKKPRQFDIRAGKNFSRIPEQVRFSIECKHLHDTYPIIVHELPRRTEESFHEIIVVGKLSDTKPSFEQQGNRLILRLRESCSLYRPRQWVGKALDQVGRPEKGDGFYTGDSEVYDKWAQAVSSASDLATAIYDYKLRGQESLLLGFVAPILVVPDGTLWVARYNPDGTCAAQPSQSLESHLYLNTSIVCGRIPFCAALTISHLAIVTLAGLSSMLTRWCDEARELQSIFDNKGFGRAIDEHRNS